MLVLEAAYQFGVAITTSLIDSDGLGYLKAVVLVFLRNAMKFASGVQ